MNLIKENLTEILRDLKDNYGVIGVKSEFETEGATEKEAFELKELSEALELDFTIKIGGAEAVTDMNFAQKIRCENIVAPMIETPYAFKKFINSAINIFDVKKTEFMINIETVTGYQNLNEILQLPESEFLSGIILGRYDMASSMGLSRENVNCDKILEIAQNISQKTYERNMFFTIGGGVSESSIMFFNKIFNLDKFETRKIIFDAKKSLKQENICDGILKAIKFEIIWLQNKENQTFDDKARLQMLQNSCKSLKIKDFAGNV